MIVPIILRQVSRWSIHSTAVLLLQFGVSHDMIFNQKKSASVYIISKTLKGAHLPNVYLNGEVILQVDSVQYLGHHLTNDLHDDLDIRRQCRAINVRSNIIFRKFHMCRVSVKLKLFNSYYAST